MNTNIRSISRIMNSLESQALRRNWGIPQLERHFCKYHLGAESSDDGDGDYWFRVFGDNDQVIYEGHVLYEPTTGKIFWAKATRIYDFGKEEFEKIEKLLNKALKGQDKRTITNDKGFVYITTHETEDYEKVLYFEFNTDKYVGSLEFIHNYGQWYPERYVVFKDETYSEFDENIEKEFKWIVKNFIK